MVIHNEINIMDVGQPFTPNCNDNVSVTASYSTELDENLNVTL